MNDIADLLHAAAEERPDLVEKTAEILATLEVAEPEFAQEVVDRMNQIAGVVKEKTAGVVDIWATEGSKKALKEFGAQAAVGAAGMVVAGLGAAVATDLYDAAKHGLTKARNFRRIVQATPELQKYEETRVRAAYNALHRYAPEFTADPIMGGSVLSTLSSSPVGMEHALLTQMVRARKELQEAKHKQITFGKSEIK